MILTLDTNKYVESGIGLYDYAILLMYEKKDDLTAHILAKHLGLTLRTCYAKRKWLVDMGWLRIDDFRYYYLTEKTKQLLAA